MNSEHISSNTLYPLDTRSVGIKIVKENEERNQYIPSNLISTSMMVKIIDLKKNCKKDYSRSKKVLQNVVKKYKSCKKK